MLIVTAGVSLFGTCASGWDLSTANSARAQDATPAPATCDVTPRPITFIADLAGAPPPEVTSTPVSSVPQGVEVTDPETRVAVIAVVETLITCVNQGELLRSFALFDDEYLRRLIDPEGILRDDVAIELAKSIATPETPEPDELTVLEDVLTLRQLPDGSVAIVFRTRGGVDREPDDTQVDLLVVRKQANRWLIVDGLTDLDPGSTRMEWT